MLICEFMSQAQPLDDASVEALTETFRLLGDATRVRILDALSHAELCVNDLARRLSLSESAVSHQLRLLRSVRLVALQLTSSGTSGSIASGVPWMPSFNTRTCRTHGRNDSA